MFLILSLILFKHPQVLSPIQLQMSRLAVFIAIASVAMLVQLATANPGLRFAERSMRETYNLLTVSSTTTCNATSCSANHFCCPDGSMCCAVNMLCKHHQCEEKPFTLSEGAIVFIVMLVLTIIFFIVCGVRDCRDRCCPRAITTLSLGPAPEPEPVRPRSSSQDRPTVARGSRNPLMSALVDESYEDSGVRYPAGGSSGYLLAADADRAAPLGIAGTGGSGSSAFLTRSALVPAHDVGPSTDHPESFDAYSKL